MKRTEMQSMKHRAPLLAGLLAASLPLHAAEAPYSDVEIARTSHGVAHVTAPSYQKLGFGIGYAYASDNGCTLAEQVMTVNGERSRYLGAEGKALVGVDSFTNLTSDIFHRTYMDDAGLAKANRRATPRSQQLLRGFVAGYNHHLRVSGPDGAGPSCKGAAWVRPMTMRDIYRMIEASALLASGASLADGFAEAGQGPAAMPVASQEQMPPFGLGSNGIAFGRDATANQKAMVVANPHFPWNGINRFYQLHMTIPGELDVMGVMLPPLPVIAIGFNRDIAWTHTVSTAARFTLSELSLAPRDPRAYIVDGKVYALEKRLISVPVRGHDGTVTNHVHNAYWSRSGPIIAAAKYGIGWSAHRAYALTDANRYNSDLVETWLGMAKGKSVEDIRTALTGHMGIPWVNTIAADRNGNALYADIGRVPNVDAAMTARCLPSAGAAALAPKIHILKGDTQSCRWSGFLPASAMRATLRGDYVSNSNDSYWLINARAERPSLAPILGPTAVAQRFRTREALLTIDKAIDAGQRFTPSSGLDLIYSNRNYSGMLLAKDVIALCAMPDSPADLQSACHVIAGWDLHNDLDSRGALLFREFWSRAREIPDVFAVPFDAADPLNTPRSLNIQNAGTRKALLGALRQAVAALADLGLRADVSIREGQRLAVNGTMKPVTGGDWYDGVLNLNLTRPIKGAGYEPFDGASYIAAIGFDDDGPVAEGLLVYGQSSEPGSPYYYDQLDLYASKGRYALPFKRADIEADADFTLQPIPPAR